MDWVRLNIPACPLPVDGRDIGGVVHKEVDPTGEGLKGGLLHLGDSGGVGDVGSHRQGNAALLGDLVLHLLQLIQGSEEEIRSRV